MPAIGFPHNLIEGLSDFWNRFFNDANQLEALYKGSAILIGQAYLDYMSSVLGVALKDAVALDKEFYRMLAVREDELAFIEGVVPADNRWSYALTDGVVNFASLDNQVYEPTASLEPNRDFEVVNGVVLFHTDPTNINGAPLPGYARRTVDVETGGEFGDTVVTDWLTSGINKGDTLRILDIGTDGAQRKVQDYEINLVRAPSFYISPSVPFIAIATPVNYVVIRKPANAQVFAESITITGVGTSATLAHPRIDQGSVRIYAKAPDGSDVKEARDYVVNYEAGIVTAVTTWLNSPPYGVDYTWQEVVWPLSLTGEIIAVSDTTPVLQMAFWAPDTLVDRLTLANNFGFFINRMEPSTEAYRAFIAGIFQLYVLGPVLERVESALNVVLNLPVVKNDGELYLSTDTTDPLVDRILTKSPINGLTLTYTFPKGTPLRTDLFPDLSLLSFDPLTTAVTVTDYVETPDWWHGEIIPTDLFNDAPPVYRRIATADYVAHVYGAPDLPEYGDPGLFFGTDDGGVPLVPPPTTVYRHRVAFVLMDQYLKYHTFSVKFDPVALSASVGSAFTQSLIDFNQLVLTAKPAHTYPFATGNTAFNDAIEVDEIPISFDRLVGSRVNGPDKVIFTDNSPNYGGGVWLYGDYFKYELWTASTSFPSVGVPVTLANVQGAPRHRRLVRVYIPGDVGGVVLVENRDYTVDYVNGTVTRLTAWTSTTSSIVYRQLNIGNTSNAAIGAGDMYVFYNGVDPALQTAAFAATAPGWDGVNNPPSAPRDIGMVEHALVVFAH